MKIAVYYKILLKTVARKFCKIFNNVTSWRSAMILKKTSIKVIFLEIFLNSFTAATSRDNCI